MLHTIRSFPRGVPLLFAMTMLTSVGFYSLIPYLSLHVTKDLGLTAALAGALLMVRQMSQQGPTFFTGMLADRIGYRAMMSLGMVIRGIGFGMFAFVEHPIGLFTAAVLAGGGGALFEPTRSAAISVLTPEEKRGEVFALFRVIANVGLVLSALLGAWLIFYDFRILSLVCGGIFLGLGALTYWRLPNIQVQVKTIPFRTMWNTVIADRNFLLLVACGIGFWFMYMQLFLTIPLHVVELTGRAESISAVNLVLASLVILFQLKVSRVVSRFNLNLAVIVGLFLMGSGLLVLGLVAHLAATLLGVVLFACGIMIVEPTFYDLTARYAKREMSATYYGFSALAMAVGGGLSQGVGGYLLDTGKALGMPSLLWLVCAVVGLVSVGGMWRLYKKTSQPVPQSTVGASS